MIGYVAMTRMLLLDGVLAFFVIAALLSGHNALQAGSRRRWGLLSAVLCGVGMLTKGPVALVLVLPSLIALRWLDRGTTPHRMGELFWYGLIACVVALPWYVAMLMTNETFGVEFFVRHHLQRYLAPAHHERPFWYYLPTLALELMPWTFIVPAVISRWKTLSSPERFLMVFAAWCFVFFSAAKCKLPTYLLPMLPALAVLIGSQIRHLLAGAAGERRQWVAWSGGLVGLLVVLAFRDVGIYLALREGVPRIDILPLVVAAGLGVMMIVRWTQRRWSSAIVGWSVGLAVAWFVVLWMCQHAIPEFAESTSIVSPCRRLAARADSEGIPYIAHRNSWDAVSFMLNREELEVYSSKEWPAFVAWLHRHRRCMVWLREGDGRIAKFVKMLPPEIELEELFDAGKVQGLILRRVTTRDSDLTATRDR
jgi:4-amino-4-deoxy-L-arabinose transferase-like glycosyltransferase